MVGPELHRCVLCNVVVPVQPVSSLDDAMTSDDYSGPEHQASEPLYHSVCGGELYPESGSDLLMAEVRELARSGKVVATYDNDNQECWALVGPAGDRTSPTWAARTTETDTAAREARRHMARVLQLEVPDVDVSALADQGLTPQWGILEDGDDVALRVWRGDRPALDGIATGTPVECVERVLRRVALDG